MQDAIPDRERLLAGLTAAQADGLACVWCAADYLAVRVPHRPVGRSETGSQVFACAGECTTYAEAFRVFERHGVAHIGSVAELRAAVDRADG